MSSRSSIALRTLVLSLLLVLAAGAGTAVAATSEILGAGSTLVAPLEAEWAAGFHTQSHITVRYDPVDSAAGIDDVVSKQVDFAATDAPMSPGQASQCTHCGLIPWGVSAIGIGYHIGSLGSGLRLTGSVLSGIFLGTIKRWNDPKIRALNPKLKLPNLKIVPIYRNDGAGTTYALSDFLSRISATWAHKEGTGTSIPFSAGNGAQGDYGAVGLLKAVNGGIAAKSSDAPNCAPGPRAYWMNCLIAPMLVASEDASTKVKVEIG